jgi:hypothetical protein
MEPFFQPCERWYMASIGFFRGDNVFSRRLFFPGACQRMIGLYFGLIRDASGGVI